MSDAFARFDAFPHWTLDRWQPAFPPGRLERIYLHWSGGDYETAYTAYHYCIAWDGRRAFVVETSDLRANMRDVYATQGAYTAHTLERNSFAAGISVMAMQDAQPDDFGRYPLVDAAVHALCAVAARLARTYGIPVDPSHVMTHAEAAVIDGYFGAGDEHVRWDIARLHSSPVPLVPDDARETGNQLRNRIVSPGKGFAVSAPPCTHLDHIHDVKPSSKGCEDCLKIGAQWVHLRECLECGHVGCCDSSPNRHATKHFHATHHPVMRSFEPGERWKWCYIDEVSWE